MFSPGCEDAGVGAQPDDRLVVTDSVRVPRHELRTAFTASGGPGGQHANKTATRVELTFDVTTTSAFDERQRARVIAKLGPTVRVVADDERSQLRNRVLAEERLARAAASGVACSSTAPADEADSRVTATPAR